MALITTPGAVNADSYVTVAEADDYVAARYGAEDSWLALSEEGKERRLQIAALALDSLPFRGVRACLTQALAFPRLLPGTVLFEAALRGGSRPVPFKTWAEVESAASLAGVEVPGVPKGVKEAQVEVAYQVVHNELMNGGTVSLLNVSGLRIGTSFDISFTTDGGDRADTFGGRLAVSALSLVRLYLRPYLSGIVGAVI